MMEKMGLVLGAEVATARDTLLAMLGFLVLVALTL